MTEPTAPEAPKPTVVEVVDEHGETHWTAYGSPTHQRMQEPEPAGEPVGDSAGDSSGEVADAGTEVPAPSDDLDAGSATGGSGDPEPPSGDTDHGGDEGVSRAKSRR